MRVAILAPLYEPVPPEHYGGTERVVYYLSEELVRRGHHVTLFGTGDSRTSADLVPVCDDSLNRAPSTTDPIAYHVLQLGMALERASEFDLIHSHCDFRALPFGRLCHRPIVSTNHNRLDAPENQSMLQHYPDAPLTALSRSHMSQAPNARWLGVCYNGIPVETYPFRERPGNYLAFIGRLSPEKGPRHAIDVALRSGVPLKLAGKINNWERAYFDAHIRPRLDGRRVEYVGELDERQKREFLANALALVFPICWPEPFGMVMIEAMATGTPVLSFTMGAAPEVVEDGVTGFLARDVLSMARQVSRVPCLNRLDCRDRVSHYFSDRSMTDSYENAYRLLLAESGTVARAR